MRIKDDYMQNGQLKPSYNVQVVREGQYGLAYSLYSNPTDTRKLIPFLDEIEKHNFELPKHIVADAGYGSEQNYNDILSNRKREALITYNMYLKEQKKKYKQNGFNPATGSMMKKRIHIHALIRNFLNFVIILFIMTEQAFRGNLKSTSVKTVRVAHSVHYVQKQKRVTIGN